MDSDDDFITPWQARKTQSQSNAHSSTVTSSSSNRQLANWLSQANPGSRQPVVRQSQAGNRSQAPGPSQEPQITQERLSQLQEGIAFLTDQLQQLTGERGIKRPAEIKPNSQPEKKANVKEQCQLCKKFYANKTTLFRHYYSMHKEMNPEKYHGCSVNDTVVSIDTSFREIECSVCSYVAPNQSSLEHHNRTLHSNVGNPATNLNNKENVRISNNIVKDKMFKCEDCACYFEERTKFDEHMKIQHCFEIACKICNKNLLFKDIDKHVKQSHPDVYKKKKDKNEKIVVEKVMRNRKGKKVHVFVCTKCDYKMYDKMNARKHANGHMRLKIKAREKTCSKSVENSRDLSLSNDVNIVIFTCDDCNVSTHSYDVTVDHSQNHVTNDMYKEQCITQTCPICELKFEPLCYKNHMDLHYNDKEINKESFKYYTYKFQSLLTENWFDTFDMTDPTIKNMIAESIYASTRSVKMRVMNEGGHKLYKCCQCDHFVEPIAVANHTMNYDTCLKVKGNYACDVCERKFSNRLTRDKHAKAHNDNLSFKIVIFNNTRDKEFNTLLNDPNTKINNCISKPLVANQSNNSDANDHVKVYKCLCGLCFVRKETADIHAKICPGKDQKLSCPKCNNFFNSEELLVHCFEHHVNETKITIENIIPNAIVIDSDDEIENANVEIIEIDSSDEEVQDECDNNIRIGSVNANVIIARDPNEVYTVEHNVNTRERVITKTTVTDLQQIARMDTMHLGNSVIDEGNNLEIFDVDTIEATDDDSEDTICYEIAERHSGDAAHSTVNRADEIKCVPTNLLLNPFRLAADLFNRTNIAMIKNEISADIENVRERIEDITESFNNESFSNISIKEEKPWLFDPTDFSNICGRRSLRQIESHPQPSAVKDDIYEILLTDDEEEVSNTDQEQTGNNLSPQRDIGNVSNNTSPITKQTETANTDAELMNEMSITLDKSNTNNRATDHDNNMSPLSVNNCNKDHPIPINENNTGTNTNTNNTANSVLSKEVINGENYSDEDDDLFMPSANNNNIKYLVSEPNYNAKEIHLQIEDQVISTNNTTSTNVNLQNPEGPDKSIYPEDIHLNEDVIHANDTSVNVNVSIHDDNTRNYRNSVATLSDIIQANNEQVTSPGGTTNNTDTCFNNAVELNPGLNPDATISNTHKGYAEHMDNKIKTELIAQNEQHIENNCDIGHLVEIKTEPNDVLENEFHLIKENGSLNAQNDKNCIIC